MKFLKRLAELRAINTAATETNQAVLQQADKDHEVALAMREKATKQAGQLTATDRRNHYSESLTQSFQGRIA